MLRGPVLCSSQATEIYQHKLSLLQPSSFGACLQTAESRMKGQSVPVAELFGVSPKTVRDIWNRRTWACATQHLWTNDHLFGSTMSSIDVRQSIEMQVSVFLFDVSI